MPQASASTSQPAGRPTVLPLSRIPAKAGAVTTGPGVAQPTERVRF